MKIYLIRHGIAEERSIYVDDEQRSLVTKGIEKVNKIGKGLLAAGVKFDRILTSPLVRAYQTAEILKKRGLGECIESFSPLKPDGNIEGLLNWLQENRNLSFNHVALVGHQPDLGNWAEMLVWGTIKEQIVVKKAGIIGLSLPHINTPIGNSSLFLLTSPKWMNFEKNK